MWGIAWSWHPGAWRLGRCAAFDEIENRIVGVWYCCGPLAVTYDYE